jgi:hypothetical protein
MIPILAAAAHEVHHLVTGDERSMIQLKHPYSADLVPSDFYLFPTIKERLTDTRIFEFDPL